MAQPLNNDNPFLGPAIGAVFWLINAAGILIAMKTASPQAKQFLTWVLWGDLPMMLFAGWLVGKRWQARGK